jgi:hypothetical protein
MGAAGKIFPLDKDVYYYYICAQIVKTFRGRS